MTETSTSVADRLYGVQPQQLYAASSAVDAGAIELCANLTREQLGWSPQPGIWSISQNLAHLRATNEVLLPAVDAALQASRERDLRSPGPFSLNLFGRAMVWRMESRPIWKMQAPKAVRPGPTDSPLSQLEDFLASQSAIRRRIASADGVHLTALRFRSPVMGCFRFNLLEFFSISNAHARRHLRQAGNVRRALPR